MREITAVPSKGRGTRRWGRLPALVVLLAGCLLLPAAAQAQISDSNVDTIYVDTTFVPNGSFDAGDTIWVGVGVVNTFEVGAMGYRLALPDTTRIVPAWIADTAIQGTEIVVTYPVRMRFVGRGLAFDKPSAITTVVVRNPDTVNVITGLLVDFEGTASLPEGRGTVLELAFVAKTGIDAGDTTRVRVADDLTKPLEPRNNLSDLTGTIAVYPRLRTGLVLYGEEQPPPGNNPPAITFSPPLTSYAIKQGESVAFSVTATDPDTTNDLVTLTAGVPAGATFTPSNPVTGTVTVTGHFEWTPNFSQEGTFDVAFSASDNLGASASRTVQIIVEKQPFDILFTSSAANASPRGGIPGKSPVFIPIDVLASRDIYGIQFDLVLTGSAFHVDSISATSKLDNFTLFDNIGADPDTVRIITFSVTGDSIPLDGNTTLMEIAVTVDSLAAPGAYPITFIRAVEAITPDPMVGSVDMMVQNGVIYVDALGDVNLDQATDVADMVNLTGYILTRVTLNERQLDVADVNVDGLANVVDLVAIINSVLGFSPLTAPVVPVFTGGEAELQLVFGGQSGDEAIYYLEGVLPTDVAGMELSLNYDASLLDPYVPSRVAEGSGLSVQSVREDGRMKIVAYYNADPDNVVPAGPGRYLQLPIRLKNGWTDGARAPLVLEAAVLSDPAAAKVPVKSTGGAGVLPTTFVLRQNYPNPFNPSTTIEFLIDGGSQERVTLDLFNILGQHVTTLVDDVLPPGEHSAVWDGADRFGRPVATGVYLYRLRVGAESETRKMLLLK